MKKILLLSLLFVVQFVAAQLYVSPNTYMYVSNQYVTVTGNVELNTASTSNLYLRNQGQLIQKTTGAGTNTGRGDLSVYQEGTVNNFLYNYWCSPVGNTLTNTTVNNPFGISQLGRPASLTTFTSPDLSNAALSNGTDAPYAIAQRWIWMYNVPSTLYASWVYVGATNTVPAGLGFTMKGTTAGNQQYDFRGKPNDGTMTHTVGNGQFTLVGNPYPSAIDLNMFLAGDNPGTDNDWTALNGTEPIINNPNIDGTAYFWEQVPVATHLLAGYQGGYGTYTPAGGYVRANVWNYNTDGTQNTNLDSDGDLNPNLDGTVFERRFTPIGQGFMVKGNALGTTVSMQNKFRLYRQEGALNQSQFAKNSNVVAVNPTTNTNPNFEAIPNVNNTDYTLQKKGYAPQVRIHAIANENQGIIRSALGFGTGYTNGFDRAADAQSTSINSPYNFYHVLENDDKEYSMSIAPFDVARFYPIGFRNNQPATFKIKAVSFYNIDSANTNVYLFDSITGLYHDIKNTAHEVTLPAGTNNTRYKVTFQNTALSNIENSITLFDIYQNNIKKVLTINNPQSLKINSCEIYDMTGKVVVSNDKLGTDNNYEISTSTLAEGVYIAKLNTASNSEIVKKVIISNSIK